MMHLFLEWPCEIDAVSRLNPIFRVSSFTVMPIYTYEVIGEMGEVVEIYEAEQEFGSEPLKIHPVTGEALRKVFTAPGINTTYSDWGKKLEAGNLAQSGFTRYERDKTTGRYFKSNPGQGPEQIDPRAGE